jgi:ankyrin repeat protein
VNANHQNQSGNPALILASACGCKEGAVELLKHDKVDVNLQDNDGNTAFICASKKGPD